MGNMSYCRYENTRRDLDDCEGDLGEIADGEKSVEDLSESERAEAKRLVDLCRSIVDDYGDMVDGWEE